MDQAAQVASRLNLGILKEPRGFIKTIQLIIAIFAFATTTSHSSVSKFSITCPNQPAQDLEIKVVYPFRLSSDNTYTLSFCNDTLPTTEIHPYGDFASSSQFYVFVGVMAWLYTIGALVVYIIFDDKYRQNDNIPLVDFVVSAVFTALWLISASAWADSLTDLKYYGDPNELFEFHIPECLSDAVECIQTQAGNYASLNVSIIFGFLNMGVWGGNLWFLWKETRWFKANQAPAAAYPPAPGTADYPGNQGNYPSPPGMETTPSRV
jgi:hypothetical protein